MSLEGCKEAALFVPTGTMGNLVSVLVHCEVRGCEVILGDASHVHIYEQGGISQFGGVHPRPLPNLPDGTIDLDLIKQTIRPDDIHFPTTRLLILVRQIPLPSSSSPLRTTVHGNYQPPLTADVEFGGTSSSCNHHTQQAFSPRLAHMLGREKIR